MFIAVLTIDIISFKDEGGVGETLGALVTCEVLWMEDLTKGTGKWTTYISGGERARENVGVKGMGRRLCHTWGRGWFGQGR